MKKLNLRDLVIISFLLGAQIALSRVVPVINTPIAKISFGFIPVVLVAILYKPSVTMVFGGMADFIGAILFPIGTYYPVFTLTAIIREGIIGFGLYKKKLSFPRILIVFLTSTALCTVLLNTYWISLLFDKMFWPLLISRASTAVVKVIIQVMIIYAMERASVFDRIIKIKNKRI